MENLSSAKVESNHESPTKQLRQVITKLFRPSAAPKPKKRKKNVLRNKSPEKSSSPYDLQVSARRRNKEPRDKLGDSDAEKESKKLKNKEKMEEYIKEALEKRDERKVYYYNQQEREMAKYKFCDKLADLKNFGAGVYLFFLYAKQISIVFMILAVFSIVKCYLLSTMDGLKDSSTLVPFYMTYSLANASGASAATVPNQHLFIFVDAAPTIILTIYLVWFTIKIPRVEKQLKEEYYTTSDYAIQVLNLDPHVKHQEVDEAFEQFGPVVQVYLFKKFRETVNMMNEMKRVRKILDKQGKSVVDLGGGGGSSVGKSKQELRSEKRIVDMRQKFLELTLKVRAQRRSNDVFCAFVIFEYPKSKQDALKAYRYHRRCDLFGFSSPFVIKNRKAYIEDPQNPSNINFHNLEYGKWEKLFRMLIVLCISIVLLAFSLIFTAFIYANTNQDKVCTDAPTTETIKNFQKADLTKDQLRCFCNQLAAQERFSDYSEYCEDFQTEYIQNLVISFLAGILTFIFNSAIRWSLKVLASFRKFHTVEEKYISLLSYIFPLIFFNTAIITLLIYTDFYGLKIGLVLMAIVNADSTESTVFNDLNLEWYAKVGVAVTFTMMINVIMSGFLTLKKYLHFKYQVLTARWCRDKNEVMDWLKPQIMKFHFRYAYSMLTAGMALIYEPMMPYFMVLGAATLWIQFLAAKYLFCNYSAKPLQFDSQIAQKVTFTMMVFSVINLFLKIYSYGVPGIMPEDLIKSPSYLIFSYPIVQAITAIEEGEALNMEASMTSPLKEIRRRLSISSGLTALLVLQIFVYCFFFLVSYLTSICCGKAKGSKISHSKLIDRISELTMKEILQIYCLTTYNIEKNPLYSKYFKNMKHLFSFSDKLRGNTQILQSLVRGLKKRFQREDSDKKPLKESSERKEKPSKNSKREPKDSTKGDSKRQKASQKQKLFESKKKFRFTKASQSRRQSKRLNQNPLKSYEKVPEESIRVNMIPDSEMDRNSQNNDSLSISINEELAKTPRQDTFEIRIPKSGKAPKFTLSKEMRKILDMDHESEDEEDRTGKESVMKKSSWDYHTYNTAHHVFKSEETPSRSGIRRSQKDASWGDGGTPVSKVSKFKGANLKRRSVFRENFMRGEEISKYTGASEYHKSQEDGDLGYYLRAGVPSLSKNRHKRKRKAHKSKTPELFLSGYRKESNNASHFSAYRKDSSGAKTPLMAPKINYFHKKYAHSSQELPGPFSRAMRNASRNRDQIKEDLMGGGEKHRKRSILWDGGRGDRGHSGEHRRRDSRDYRSRRESKDHKEHHRHHHRHHDERKRNHHHSKRHHKHHKGHKDKKKRRKKERRRGSSLMDLF